MLPGLVLFLMTSFAPSHPSLPVYEAVQAALVEEYDIVPKNKEKTVSEEPEEKEKEGFFERFKKFGSDKEEEEEKESSLLKTSLPRQ